MVELTRPLSPHWQGGECIGLGGSQRKEMRASLLVAACCYGAASAAGVGLNDDEIVTGAPVQRLDGLWSATNAATGMTIAGSVPGDLVTDLQRCVRRSGPTGCRAPAGRPGCTQRQVEVSPLAALSFALPLVAGRA